MRNETRCNNNSNNNNNNNNNNNDNNKSPVSQGQCSEQRQRNSSRRIPTVQMAHVRPVSEGCHGFSFLPCKQLLTFGDLKVVWWNRGLKIVMRATYYCGTLRFHEFFFLLSCDAAYGIWCLTFLHTFLVWKSECFREDLPVTSHNCF